MIIQTNIIAFNKQQSIINQKIKQLLVYHRVDVVMIDVSSLIINDVVETALCKFEVELKNS